MKALNFRGKKKALGKVCHVSLTEGEKTFCGLFFRRGTRNVITKKRWKKKKEVCQNCIRSMGYKI